MEIAHHLSIFYANIFRDLDTQMSASQDSPSEYTEAKLADAITSIFSQKVWFDMLMSTFIVQKIMTVVNISIFIAKIKSFQLFIECNKFE